LRGLHTEAGGEALPCGLASRTCRPPSPWAHLLASSLLCQFPTASYDASPLFLKLVWSKGSRCKL
jgi:hypothetical protein